MFENYSAVLREGGEDQLSISTSKLILEESMGVKGLLGKFRKATCANGTQHKFIDFTKTFVTAQ